MKGFDESRDEVRLSRSIIDKLAGQFRFMSPPDSSGMSLVDVPATNRRLTLSDSALEEFTAVPPSDPRVRRLESVTAAGAQIDPSEITVLLLCGGLSFRSQGEIHPLKLVRSPRTGTVRTLLDLQLSRFFQSPIKAATCVIVATPLNEAVLRQGLESFPELQDVHICVGGMAPRLLPRQKTLGSPLPFRDPSGEITYNPIGHLEALRWIIVSGLLSQYGHSRVIIIVSYSNWGRIFNSDMLYIAGSLSRPEQTANSLLFAVEVTPRNLEKDTGSILVSHASSQDNLRLVKFSYGSGKFRATSGNSVLMSNNTLYFEVRAIVDRLVSAAPAVGLPASRDAVMELLRDAAVCRHRDQLANLFEVAFPVNPHLIPFVANGSVLFLRVERDLDQLSLMPGHAVMTAVEVHPSRGVFLKLPEDFEDPTKQAFLFENEP